MAPCSSELAEEHTLVPIVQKKIKQRLPNGVVWSNVISYTFLHVSALYGIFLVFTSAKLLTTAFAYTLYLIGVIGVTAGAHRLWSHKAYKANFPLKVLLMVFQTIAFQHTLESCSQHSQLATIFQPRNTLNILKDADDNIKKRLAFINSTGLITKLYYLSLMVSMCFVFPTCIPILFWGETFKNSWFVATVLRFTINLHAIWLINSLAHFNGSKPYDKSIHPTENLFVGVAALGEGWHNYHHTFPWDYKAAELGNYGTNITTLFIDFMAKIGWAYELKTVSPEMIVSRARRTGDGTHVAPDFYPYIESSQVKDTDPHGGEVWGWDDEDLSVEVKNTATVIKPAKVQ